MKILLNLPQLSISLYLLLNCQKTNTLQHSLILKSSPHLQYSWCRNYLQPSATSPDVTLSSWLIECPRITFIHMEFALNSLICICHDGGCFTQKDFVRHIRFVFKIMKMCVICIPKPVVLVAVPNVVFDGVFLDLFFYSWNINVMIQSQEWDESSAEQIKNNRSLRPHEGRSW